MLLLLTSSIFAQTQNLTQGLISVWEFDETSGNIVDEIDSNHGINDGAIRGVTGKIGAAFSFDGLNDKAQIPHSSSLNLDAYVQSFSVSLWVNADGTKVSRIFQKRPGGAGVSSRFPFTFRGNPVFFGAYDGAQFPRAYGGNVWDSQWHHLVGVVDNTLDEIRLYVDGVHCSTVNNTLLSTTANTTSLKWATSGDYVQINYKGFIDQPAIWNRALSSAEITQLYNSGNGLAYSNWGATSTPLVAGSITPTSLMVNSGESPGTINGTAASGGTGSYNYQWEKSIDDGVNWSVIPGADQESYTPPVLTQSTWYRRKVTSGTETAHSNISEVIVSTGGSSGLWTDHTTHISHNGKVCINTTSNPGDYELMVNGEIRSKEIIVETNWADFVFKPEYRLKPLHEVEQFINTNGHLPGIPTEAEIKEKGVNVGEINSKLLQKIEELTLHAIRQQKVLEKQQKEIEKLKKVIGEQF